MKQETLEEAGTAYSETVTENKTSHMIGFYNGAKWMQENSYSEEDLRNAYRWGTQVNQGTKEHFNEWFEQFKKK